MPPKKRTLTGEKPRPKSGNTAGGRMGPEPVMGSAARAGTAGKGAVKSGKRPGSGVGDANAALKDASPADRPNLFMHKLRLCSKGYDFSDPEADVAAKERKRTTLLEICEFINAPAKICCLATENVLSALFNMVTANLLTLNEPTTNGVEMQQGSEEEEPALFCEAAYNHMELVMEILLRLVTKGDTDAKMMKRFLNTKFVSTVLSCFTSRDPRLREYLKTILHRVYGRFMAYRLYIRNSITHIFAHFTYEDPRHAGVGELLEILGSIINGFALPLKDEHRLFLEKSLLPLHKPSNVAAYHPQLCYCIVQFVEKDEQLAVKVIQHLLKWWPHTNSAKQVLFLGEIEEIVEITGENEFKKIMVPLFRTVAKCLESKHFQVAERALCLWQSSQIVEHIKDHAQVLLPIVFPALKKDIDHWHQSVKDLAEQVVEMYNQEHGEFCRDHARELESQDSKLNKIRKEKWGKLGVTDVVNA